MDLWCHPGVRPRSLLEKGQRSTKEALEEKRRAQMLGSGNVEGTLIFVPSQNIYLYSLTMLHEWASSQFMSLILKVILLHNLPAWQVQVTMPRNCYRIPMDDITSN